MEKPSPQSINGRPGTQMANYSSAYSMNPNYTPPKAGEFAGSPPSSEVVQGLQRAFALPGRGEGLGDRLAGVGQAAMGGFGLLEEGGTRLFTGNRYYNPSDAFGLDPNSGWAFATNTMFDPFVMAGTLFGGSKVVESARNLSNEQKMAGYVKPTRELLLDARGSQPLLFHDHEQALELARRAGIYAPIHQDPELKSWYFNFDGVENPHLMRAQLRDAVNANRETYLYDPNLKQRTPYVPTQGATSPEDVTHQVWTPWEPEYAPKRPWQANAIDFKENNSFRKLLTPSNWSPFMKSAVQTMESTNSEYSKARQNFQEFIQEANPGLDFTRGGNSHQNRAFLYRLLGDNAGLKEDVGATTAYAQNQNKIEEFAQKSRNRIIDELSRVPAKKLEQLGVRDISVLRNPQEEFPTELKNWLAGGYFQKETGKWIGGLTLDANEGSPASFLSSAQRRLQREGIQKPVARAIENAINDAVKKSYTDPVTGKSTGIGPREESLARAVLKSFVGNAELSQIDKEWNAAIINNRQTLRGATLSDLWNKLSTADVEGSLSSMVGVVNSTIKKLSGGAIDPANTLIEGARQNRSITKQAVAGARELTYKALMGFALDSPIHNVVAGSMNTLAQFGLKSFEHIVPAWKAASNPAWAQAHGLDSILSTTNGVMEDIFRKTPYISTNPAAKVAKSLWDHSMDLMSFTENFNRGLAFYTALDHNLNTARMGQLEAYEKAKEAVSALHFGHSNVDSSPYLNFPLARVISQFNIYPMRQMELLHNWATDGSQRGNLLKYVVLSGATLGVGARHGIDLSNLFGMGMGFSSYPNYVRYRGDGILPHFTATPPVVQMGKAAMQNAVNLIDTISSGVTGAPIIDQEYTPNKAWSDLGDLMRIMTPGGRYASKVAGNFPQLFGFNSDTDVTKRWGPIYQGLGGVHYDPSRSSVDHLMKLLGFNPTSERERHDQLEMMRSFGKTYRKAIAEINDEAMTGAYPQKLINKWVKRLDSQYGPSLERNGVSRDTIQSIVRPSELSYLKRAMKMKSSTQAEQELSRFPKEIRDQWIDE